ncbi:[protein-PII] uridylyltransferase [Desulfurobacterium thermolithotrophum]|uniref:[protein-PII] uridylyltransferase n=1 Tax=Desulfurobacterium thermolithotrophum TaxID=64160 RepID=UPI0013D2A953|nr:[protein-PII] uridylyltransferase [Desulfurobacterium thermolithotrophum]
MKVLESLKERFFSEREKIKQLHLQKETGFTVADELRKALDSLLKPAFKKFFGKWDIPVVFYALGGYGRGELNFHSDIDVNLIYSGKLSESHLEDIEAFYYFLLSLKLDVGFAPRSVKEALELSEADLSVFTNLFQKRFLAGNKSLDSEFSRNFKSFVKKNKNSLVEEIIIARNDRYDRFYKTVYYQEPNVKESKGGLRDLHEAFWIAKIVYSIKNYSGFLDEKIIDWKSFRDVISAYDFLLRVRNQLHISSGRKSDILSFEMQPVVAEYFGFSENRKGIEQFMKNYFNSAIDLSVITKEIIKKSLEQIEKKQKNFVYHLLFKPKELIEDTFYVHEGALYVDEEKESSVVKNPLLVLKGFKIVQEKGLELSANAFSLFKLSAETTREKFRKKEVLAKFKEILLKAKRLSYTLELMHDCKVLGALIPDFERLRGHFQFDTYHKFTTDIHSILTVREVEKIEEKGTKKTSVREKQDFFQILQDLENPYILYIAALFHDIGKGKPGKHEIVGAGLARKYLSEMGFSSEEVEEIAWLIKNHLLMSHIAFRRDISDPELIEQFKNECGTEERLKKLFLLTYADIKAVGPGAWDNWKSSLLWKLYNATHFLFIEGRSAEELVAEKLKRRKEKVKKLLEGKIKAQSIEKFFKNADRDYLITYPSDEIAKHLLLMKEIKKEEKDYAVYHESYPDIGFTKVTIVTKYRRGLFNKIAGILSYLGLNIKGANINKAIEDECDCMVYTIHVSTISGESVPCEKLESFEKLLKELYSGNLDFEDFPQNIIRPKGFRRNIPLPVNKVKIDNKTSDRYTIVEVSTYDRLGVLYAITKVLLEMNTRLRRAIIATEGNRVIDSFYITDIEYRKITDAKLLKEIEEKILQVIK